MAMTLDLPPGVESSLARKALQLGKTPESYVADLVRLSVGDDSAETRTWREICAPVHEDFIKSGMTDEELESLINESIAEVRAERRNRKQSCPS